MELSFFEECGQDFLLWSHFRFGMLVFAILEVECSHESCVDPGHVVDIGSNEIPVERTTKIATSP